MPTIFLVGTLIDGTGRDPINRAAVVVDGGKIVESGPESSVRYERNGSGVIDAREYALIPGLIDSHCHIFRVSYYIGHPEYDQSTALHVAQAIRNASTWLMQGVTSARDVCTRDNLDIGLRDAINRGITLGPRLFVSGEGMAMTAGKQQGHDLIVTQVTGTDEARRFVRKQIRAGVDLIKIFATAGLTDGGQEQLTEEEIRAAVEEAHKAGRHVASHVIGAQGTKNSLRAGVDTIEHGTFLDEESVELMLAQHAVFVPTLSIGRTMVERGEVMQQPQALIDNAKSAFQSERRGVKMAHEAGVPIAAGTDPVYGDTVAMECKELVEVGLSPVEALQAATCVGARILRRQHQLGTVEPGKLADLVLLEGNPLEDISALEHVRYVVKEGTIVKSPELRSSVVASGT